MKRFQIHIILALVFIVLFTCGPVYAGVFGTIKDAITGNLIWGAVTLIFGALGLFFKFDGNNAKNALQKIRDVYVAFDKSDDPDSPGGEKRTAEEWEAIAKEALEAIGATLQALPARWQKKIGFNR